MEFKGDKKKKKTGSFGEKAYDCDTICRESFGSHSEDHEET